MTLRSKPHTLLALLALGMTLALAGSAGAQERQSPRGSDVSATLRVNLGIAPHWSGIRGTQIDELPAGERPNYDMFRFGGAYYVQNNDHWFMSSHESGDYTPIDDRNVPAEFSAIPREHWQHYPSAWNDQNGSGAPNAPDMDRRPMTMQVSLGYGARWSTIRGTRVMTIRGSQRPDFDLFRLGGTFYAYDTGRWYTSNRSRGEYTRIGNREVPYEMTRIPRYAWREYPRRWLDVNGNVRADLGSRDRYNHYND